MATSDNNIEKISQARIKNENIHAIFECIASSDSISRADIAKATGLSLMTVGKVADLLTKNGIASQAKPATGSAGRRAGMLTVGKKNFILVLDISSAKFRTSVMDMGMKKIDSMSYTYNDSLFPEDNLTIFFRESSTLLMKHLMDKTLAGCGICVPGEYDRESDTVLSPRFEKLEGLKISASMKRAVGFAPDRIMNSVSAAAVSEISSLPKDKRGCTVNLTLDGGVSGCIACDGRILPRKADFDGIVCENGRTLGRNLMESDSERDIAKHLGFVLRPIISVLSPDSVFISSGERVFSEWFEKDLSEQLEADKKGVSVFFENGKGARSDMGIASVLIDGILAEF